MSSGSLQLVALAPWIGVPLLAWLGASLPSVRGFADREVGHNGDSLLTVLKESLESKPVVAERA